MNRTERKKQYGSLCLEKGITSLFMQPWWLDATGEWDVSFGYRNERIVGAMPFATGTRLGIKYIGMPSFTHHLKIWMEKPADISHHKWLTREKQIIWSILDNLPPHGYFSMVFDERSFDNWLPFHWKNYRQEMRYTFIIEHSTGEELDQNLSRNLKRNIREAHHEVRLQKDIDPQPFYTLCRETYKRQKEKMPFSFDAFLKMDQAIMEHNAGVRLGALTGDDRLVAVSYLLWDDTTAYYLLAGDNEAGRATGASIFLCREALRLAFEEKKARHFDFCGSMLESITEIRRQFGATTVPLLKIFKANYKWLDIIYSLTR